MNKGILAALCGAVLFSVAACPGAERIFVSADGDDSKGTGARDKPLASLAAAAAKAKELSGADVEIVVGCGEYFFDAPVSFGAGLKGGKLSIVGASGPNGEKPRFVGGRRISAAKLKKVEDASILKKLPPEASGDLYCLHLPEFGMRDFGELRQRGFGGLNPPLEMEAFFNVKPMRLAQYPNGLKLLKIGTVLDRGTALRNPSGHDAPQPEKDANPRGAVFKFDFDRPARWIDAPDAFVKGNLSVGWAYDQIKIKRIDPAAKTIELQSPHVYGVYSNFPPKNPKWIDRADLNVRGYQVFNLIEELDEPGEYYIDRRAGIFYTLLRAAPNPSDGVYFSVLEEPMLDFLGAENVLIRNVEFAVSRGAPLRARDCANFSVDDCVVRSCGRPLEISGTSYKKAGDKTDRYAKNNRLANTKIFDNALGGAVVNGGNKRLLVSSQTVVENCEFYNNAVRKPLVTPALYIGGVGVRVVGCRFRDHPHQTLLHTGNNLVIERNLFENCCMNSSDMGVIYTYGCYAQLGNVVRYNFFTDNLANPGDFSSMVAGVYMDETSSGMLVEKNIFCRTGSMGSAPAFGAIYIHGGGHTRANGNVFIECESAFGCQTWTDEKYAAGVKRLEQWRKSHIDGGAYAKSYPDLPAILNPFAPRLNFAEANKVYNTSMAMNGDLVLRYNKNLRPNAEYAAKGLPRVGKWTPELVKKYFGQDPLVAEILRKYAGDSGR